MAIYSSILVWKIPWIEELVGYSPWGHEETGLRDFTFTCLHFFQFKRKVGNERDPGSIPGLGRLPGEGNGNPLQYSYLENPMDREAWQVTVHGVSRI